MIRKPASASGCDDGARGRATAAPTRAARTAAAAAARRPRPRATHLLEHRRTRDVEHAADHDPARLALGVGVDEWRVRTRGP